MALERREVIAEVVLQVRTAGRLAWVMMLVLPVIVLLAVIHLGSWLAAPAAQPIMADAVVVLGGDGGNGRAKRAGKLFLAGFARQVVLTGHPGKHEISGDVKADLRVKLLIDMGVPPSVLLFDSVSRNSWEEARNGRQIMDEKGWQRVLVVSDPPHLRRLQLAWWYALSDGRKQFTLVASEADWWHPALWWRDKRSAIFVGRETLGLLYYALCVVFVTS